MWIVPIALSYDATLETTAYVREVLGRPKPIENVANVSHAVWSLLAPGAAPVGDVHLRFAAPISVRAAWVHQCIPLWHAAGLGSPARFCHVGAPAWLALRQCAPARRADVHAVTQRVAQAVMTSLSAAVPVAAPALVAAVLLLPPAVRTLLASTHPQVHLLLFFQLVLVLVVEVN